MSQVMLRVPVVALVLCILVACGGGGESAQAPLDPQAPAPVPTPAPTPTPTPSATPDRLLAGWAYAADSLQNQAFLQVVDPVAPSASVAVASGLPIDANLAAPRAWTARGAQGYEVGMAPQAYYVAAGRVHQLSLRRGESQAPARISSVEDACFVQTAAALVADASDAWVAVTTAGPDGVCSSVADNRTAFVRAGTPATSPATFLPTGVVLPESSFPLIDFEAGRVVGFLMLDTRAGAGQLLLYSVDLTTATPVANASGLRRVRLLSGDSSDSGAQYLIVDGELRRLTGAANQASLSNSLHTFVAGSGFALGATDASGTYFSDGSALLRVAGAAPAQTLATAAAGSGAIDGIYLTGAQVVVHASQSGYSGTVSTVAKTGGAATVRLTGADAGSARIVGTSPSSVYYLVERAATGLHELRSLSLDTGVDASVATGVQFIGSIWSRRFGAGALWDPIAPVTVTGLSGVLYCAPQSGERTCARSTVRRFDVASGADVPIGTIEHNLAVNNSFRVLNDNFNLYDGLPGSILALIGGAGQTADGQTTVGVWAELYVLGAEPSPSLTRITRLAP